MFVAVATLPGHLTQSLLHFSQRYDLGLYIQQMIFSYGAGK